MNAFEIANPAYWKERYDELRALGLCADCKGDSPHAARCAACCAVMNQSRSEKYRRLKAEGRCIRCGTPSDRARCRTCKDKLNAAARDRAAKRRQQRSAA